MKFNLLSRALRSFSVVGLLVASATGSLMSMEKNTSRLNFLLNSDLCIKGSSAQEMNYLVQPEELLGKNILYAVPLSEYDRNALRNGFNEAAQKEITVKVPYTLKGIRFLAEITPIIKANKKYNFFIKVQEVDNQ